jgi:hypothetical protein
VQYVHPVLTVQFFVLEKSTANGDHPAPKTQPQTHVANQSESTMTVSHALTLHLHYHRLNLFLFELGKTGQIFELLRGGYFDFVQGQEGIIE